MACGGREQAEVPGAGISKGARLSFNLLYASGVPSVSEEVAAMQTDFALAGIQLNLTSAPIDTLFSTEVACDPKTDALIDATLTDNGLGAMQSYENYLAQQLPTLWLPWQVDQVSVISNKLHGALPQDPYQQMYPQLWWLSG